MAKAMQAAIRASGVGATNKIDRFSRHERHGPASPALADPREPPTLIRSSELKSILLRKERRSVDIYTPTLRSTCFGRLLFPELSATWRA